MTGYLPKRKLPGLAWRKQGWSEWNNEVAFVRGVVLHAGWGLTGPVTQTIQTDSKFLPDGKVKLIGETYAYWCEKCFATIWEQELMMAGSIRPGNVRQQFCPHCGSNIQPLQPGTKVYCHYRFSPKGSWGAWWAEDERAVGR